MLRRFDRDSTFYLCRKRSCPAWFPIPQAKGVTVGNPLSEDVRALEEGLLSRSQFIKRSMAAGLSLASIGSILAATAKAGGDATVAAGPPASPAGTLIYGNAEPPTANYWDPAAGFGLVDEQVASLVHDTLLARDPTGKIYNQLATRVTRLSSTRVRVTLRPGVKFQDGTPLTADDVKASWDRLGAKGSKLAQALTVAPLHCTVQSPTSVDIITDEPFGAMDSALAYVKILPKADIANPANFKKRAMGCGPYRFVSYKGNSVTLEVNPTYWGKGGHVKTIRFDYISDLDARMNALLSGDIQIMTRIGLEQLQRVKGDKAFYTTHTTPPSMFIELSQHNGVLGELAVRQAVAHAIDRDAIVKGLYKGVFPVAQSSIPRSSLYYEPLKSKYPYDPDKAKALLGGRKLNLKMSTANLFSHQKEVDEAVAQYLGKVGITVDTTELEAGAFRTTYNQYDLSLNTLASFTMDPDFILSLYTGGTAEAVWHLKDPKIDALNTAQRTTVGPARQAKVTAMAKYLFDQQTTFYLADEIWYFIVSSKVRNYKRAPLVGEQLATGAWLAA